MLKACKHRYCPGYSVGDTGYCSEHQSEYVPKIPFYGASKSNPLTTPEYNSKEWKRFRASYLEEHPYCVKCGQKANSVDHYKLTAPEMVKKFGSFIYDPSYYRSLCSKCNTGEANRHYKQNGNRTNPNLR